MALVGIRTAIEAMQQKFIESFSSMGATGFTLRYREPRFHMGGNSDVQKEKKGKKKEKKSNFVFKFHDRDEFLRFMNE